MNAVLTECLALRAEFVRKAENALPDYACKYEDGEKYVRREYYERIQKDADRYYEQCLNERTTRSKLDKRSK